MDTTLLVIDDDPEIVKVITTFFELEGFTVLNGSDGRMAIQLAKVHQPAAIILDVNMPNLDGLKAIQFLRGYEETQNIPVLLLSGESSDAIYPTLDTYENMVFVKKPIDMAQIKEIIKIFVKPYPKRKDVKSWMWKGLEVLNPFRYSPQ